MTMKGKNHSKETKAKIADALEGNRNAEKWTEDLVIDVLNQMIEFAVSTYEITSGTTDKTKQDEKGYSKEKTIKKTKRGVHLKSKILLHFEIWNADWFSDIKDKFSKEGQENETVLRLLKVVDMICMTNTYNDAANGAISNPVAMMNLSTHHNWASKTKNENDTKLTVDRFQFEMPEATPEMQKKWEEAQNKEE